MEEIVKAVKQKKEFSGLPDSLIEKVLNHKDIRNKTDSEKVKLTRAFLRKYFGVFLTNKVLKAKDELVLTSHISSKKRDYSLFYEIISEVTGENFKSVIDLGCGINGFSYKYLSSAFGDVNYVGVEVTKQLCDLQNSYFKKNNFANAEVLWCDLFDFPQLENIIEKTSSPRLFLLLQVVDALENVEPNFSKSFLLEIKKYASKKDVIVISNPLKSISGKNKFNIKRKWLEEFVRENFLLVNKFDLFDEEFLIAKCI